MRKIRILIAKPGLDGHDRGAKVLARSLMDEGFEVIYTGIHQTAEDIIRSAIEEDVDVIGLSILSGAHMYHFRRVLELMKENGLDDVLLIGGGIVPEDDKKKLIEMGVNAIFNPGTSIKEISEFIKNNVRRIK
ncbi:MAG: cobalamin B12-binding domain-containing protein [Thermoplasmata archaeon]|jgi:methylmalonyl-CoA mutase C-terminal domain/subunit|nr:cobalamin B12-binding domain-containing protein [Thermoplasmata archaeon]MVT13266.1 methylmalonyl-CoA mutase [Euryarchaeota archaeon]MVT14747.1 methylmalonyl-CoA mutase [Euryarchaeota archaeon]MVT35987.1 methylmalonyl-CoA mutase [Euryarchaeota archaeon]